MQQVFRQQQSYIFKEWLRRKSVTAAGLFYEDVAFAALFAGKYYREFAMFLFPPRASAVAFKQVEKIPLLPYPPENPRQNLLHNTPPDAAPLPKDTILHAIQIILNVSRFVKFTTKTNSVKCCV